MSDWQDRDRSPWDAQEPGGTASPAVGVPLPSSATGLFGQNAPPGGNVPPGAAARRPDVPPPAPRVHEVVVRPPAGTNVATDPLERLMRSEAAQAAPLQEPSPQDARRLPPQPPDRPGSFTAFPETAPEMPAVPQPAQTPGSFTQLFGNANPASAPPPLPQTPLPSQAGVEGAPGWPGAAAAPIPNRRETRFYPGGSPPLNASALPSSPPSTTPLSSTPGPAPGGITAMLQALDGGNASAGPVSPPATQTSGPGSFTQLFAASSMRPDFGPATQADEFPPLLPAQPGRGSFDPNPLAVQPQQSGARPGSLTRMLQALENPEAAGNAPGPPPSSFGPLASQGGFESLPSPPVPPQTSHGPGGATTAFRVPEAAAQTPPLQGHRGPGEFTRIMMASQQRGAAGELAPATSEAVQPGTGAAPAGFPALPQWQMPGAPQLPQPPQLPQFQPPHFQVPQFQAPPAPQVSAVAVPKGPPWLILGLVAVIVLLIAALLLVLLLRR